MKLRNIIIILTTYICSLTYAAVPRLTVIVAVDGLHQQDLAALRDYWPQGGMRTMSEEAFQAALSLPFCVYGGAETPATLFSGVTPNEHGISMNAFYGRADRKIHPAFEDNSQRGIGTKLAVSPASIRSLTLSDRFRMLAGEKAGIYAIGLDAPTTLCMAGHSANACCWLDAEEQKWVTTTYYDEGLPNAADKQNTSGRMDELAQRVWTPRMDVAQYLFPTSDEKKKSFSYTGFAGGHTPATNDLVTDLALALQQDKKLGTDITPDLLFLQMTVLSPKATCDHIRSAEQEDMYLSLNQDIGFLQEQLDKRLGKEHYQLMVVGLPRKGASSEMLEQAGLPRKDFNVDRAVALLGTYLMALYGHERWIDGGYGQSIYLNRTLIEQKKLSLETIRRQVSEFMLEFEGVQGACSVSELPFIQGSNEANRLRASLSKRTQGDVVFWLEENWTILERDGVRLDQVADKTPQIPLLLWSGAYRNFPEKENVSALGLYSLLFE